MPPPPLSKPTQSPRAPMVPTPETVRMVPNPDKPPTLPDSEITLPASVSPKVTERTAAPSSTSPTSPMPLRRSTRERRPPQRYTDHDYQMAIHIPPNS